MAEAGSSTPSHVEDQSLHTALQRENLPIVLYKSDNFLAISKCCDIKINSDNREDVTTEHQLRHLFPELVDERCKHGFRFVHRLDYATSGVICLGLSKKSAAHLDRQFKQKSVLKFYLALVRGHVKEPCLFLDVATGDLQDEVWPNRRCAADHQACVNPKNTQTLIMCLERGQYDGEPASKLLMRPFTGRTHQLRVHCQYIGHTIVGDYTYSHREDISPDRMMLHSHKLITDTGLEPLNIISPDPFTPDLDTKWQPEESVSQYTDCLQLAENFNSQKTTIKRISLCVEES